ncbi:hypothetical protein Tco_0453174 [Tanacetum coccineum]
MMFISSLKVKKRVWLEGGGIYGEVGVEFYKGEEDERELFEIGEVGVVIFGGGEDLLEEDIEILRRSERFRRDEVIEMEKNVIHI